MPRVRHIHNPNSLQHETPTRAELVEGGPKQRETYIVIFVSSASLRWHLSNWTWLSSFFRREILAGSVDAPTRWELSRQEMPTRLELVGPEQPETQLAVVLLRSVLRPQQETEAKSSWWAMPEYNSARRKRSLQLGTVVRLGYCLWKVCSTLPMALRHTCCETGKWRYHWLAVVVVIV